MKLVEIYADTRSVGTCRGPNCGKKIMFAKVVKSGKTMPFSDPEVVAVMTRHEPSTNRLIEFIPLTESHFGDCPDAGKF